jgi:uncharacterized membrane protein
MGKKNTSMVIIVSLLLISTLSVIVSIFFHESESLKHIHGILGGIMLVLTVIHIIQNWKWITNCLFKIRRDKNDDNCDKV